MRFGPRRFFRSPSLPLLGLAGPILCACTGGSDAPSGTGNRWESAGVEVSDSAGVRIVHSRGPSWGEGQGWTVPSQPELTVGILNGPEEYQLVDVAAAARRSDGSLVVVDRGSQTVRLYDSEGTYLKTLGGPGSGPGEFTAPVSLLVSVGDSVAIWDEALLRVTRFDSEGELANVKTVDWGRLANRLGMETVSKGGSPATKGKGVASGLFPGPMEPLEDGSLLVRLVEKTASVPPSGFHRPRSGALRVSEDLSVIDTLMFFGDAQRVSVEAPWGLQAVTPALAMQTRTAHRGNPPRICIGDQEGPEILCRDPDGGRTALRWVSEPIPPTGAEVAAWREETVRLYDLKLSRDQVLSMLDQVPLPEVRPAYSRILLDPAGNLWAERGPSAAGSSNTVDFLVFGLEGSLLGVVALPPIQVLEIGPDYVLGIHRDELEIQSVRVHVLRKDSKGAK